MFPRLTERLGIALDLFVEFSTLGEYGSGGSPTPEPASAPPAAVSHAPGLGGAGGVVSEQAVPASGRFTAGRSRTRRSIAGATAGSAQRKLGLRGCGHSSVAAARSGGVLVVPCQPGRAAPASVRCQRRPEPEPGGRVCRA